VLPELYKRVVFKFHISTHLANRIRFVLAGQPSQPEPNTLTRFANPIFNG